MSNLFLVGQIVLGLYFIMAGLPHFTKAKGMIDYATFKKLPMPAASVYVTGIVLVLGGVGILFQMYLNWAYGLLAAFLVVAAVTVHNFWTEKDAQAKMTSMIMFQKNIAIAAALVMLMAR
jgi:uncharacterized membrane protein YphA (DoxX/SURF4 family)